LKHIVIIGGGPSGCMAAISCKTHHPEYKVTLIEGNDRLGVKLRLTGGGRCNLTANVSSDEIIKHTPRNGRFLYSSLDQFNVHDIMDFFTQRGLKLKEEDHHRIFPTSDKADDVVLVLENELKKLGVEIKFKTRVLSINHKGKKLTYETI
jgi:predicted Rossmann fold flavoprotein